MKKRGQIAVFIILGVVIITLSSFVYYVRVNLAKQETSSSVKKTIITPIDVTSIKKYAENCLKAVSDKGLWIVGEHGGYVDPDGNEAYGDEGVDHSFLPPTIYDGKKVPYYLEYTSEGTTNFYSLLLSEIEKKLSRYIIVEFERCFDLTAFEGAGFYIIRPNINYTKINFDFDNIPVKSNVSINRDSVVVAIEYPLTIGGKGSEAKLKDFRVNLPIRLGRLYNATVNDGNPEGVLKNITKEWDDGDTEPYNLALLDCDNYDELKQINIYSRDNDDISTKIIRLVDYNPFYYRYRKSYMFQFAIKKDPIDFTGNMCTGTVS